MWKTSIEKVACPSPTPVPDQNTSPSSWSEEDKELVREAIRCLLSTNLTYLANVTRRQGTPETDNMIALIQKEKRKNSEFKKHFEHSLEQGEKPSNIPTALSKDEFDSAYTFTDCFYTCNKLTANVTFRETKPNMLEVKFEDIFPIITIDLDNFSDITPFGEIDAQYLVAGNVGVSWRMDDYDFPELSTGEDIPMGEFFDGTQGGTIEVLVMQIKPSNKRNLTLYVR